MPKACKSAFESTQAEIIDLLVASGRELGITKAEVPAIYGEDQPLFSRVERRQRRRNMYEYLGFCDTLKLRPTDILILFSIENSAVDRLS